MARIPLIEKEQADEPTRAFYEEIEHWLKPFPGSRAQNPKIPQLWRAFAHNLDIDRYINRGTRYYLSEWPWGLQNLRLRQIIIFTITRRLGCEYAYAGNWPLAEKAGMTRAQYDAIVADPDTAETSPLFNDEERLIITYVNDLGKRFDAHDEAFEAIVQRYGHKVAFEITAFVGFRMMTSTLINTLQIADD